MFLNSLPFILFHDCLTFLIRFKSTEHGDNIFYIILFYNSRNSIGQIEIFNIKEMEAKNSQLDHFYY